MRILTNYKKPVLAGFIIFLLPVIAAASAWTLGKGHNVSYNTSTIYNSEKYYDGDGNKQNAYQDYSKYALSKRFEYGYSDDLTIGYGIDINNSKTESQHGSTKVFDLRGCGVGNDTPLAKRNTTTFEGEFFFRKKLYDENGKVFSFQPLIKTPCFYLYENGSGFTESFDAEMRALYGVSYKLPFNANDGTFFTGQYHFAELEAAYRYRSGDFADQLRIDATAGFKFDSKTMLIGQALSTFSLGREKVDAIEYAPGKFYFRRDDYNTIKLQLSAVRKVSDITSVQVGVFSDIYGKNSGSGDGLLFSIWREF